MCDYTIELDGVLNNQTDYYLQPSAVMQSDILAKGADIVAATGRTTSYTMSAPLMTSFNKLTLD